MKENVHVIFDEVVSISKGDTTNDDDNELGNPLIMLKRSHREHNDAVSLGPELEIEDEASGNL